MGSDRADVLEAGPGTGGENEGDRNKDLAGDDEVRPDGERVECGADPALDGVLDRHHGGVDVTAAQRLKSRDDGVAGHLLTAFSRLPGVERHLAERAGRTQVAVAVRARAGELSRGQGHPGRVVLAYRLRPRRFTT